MHGFLSRLSCMEVHTQRLLSNQNVEQENPWSQLDSGVTQVKDQENKVPIVHWFIVAKYKVNPLVLQKSEQTQEKWLKILDEKTTQRLVAAPLSVRAVGLQTQFATIQYQEKPLDSNSSRGNSGPASRGSQWGQSRFKLVGNRLVLPLYITADPQESVRIQNAHYMFRISRFSSNYVLIYSLILVW